MPPHRGGLRGESVPVEGRLAAGQLHLGQLREGADRVVFAECLGADAAHVGALDIHCAARAGAIMPQQNRATARQRLDALHKTRLVELAAAVVVEGAAKAPRGVVLEPAYEGGENQNQTESRERRR